jgi:hypothetical protein
MNNNNFTLIESINEYYKLKNKYETKYYEKYVQPIVTSNLSKREKRVAYSKLPKPECVNCKKNVGTIWEVKVNDDDQMKTYKAKCGDLEHPCPLDIHIIYTITSPLYDLITNEYRDVEKTKLDIIKTKNNALFFNKNVQNEFNDLLETLKMETSALGYYVESNIVRNYNPEKHKLLKQTIQIFGKEYLLPFKQMVKEYEETNNVVIMNNAVSFYVNEMIPKIKEIQSLKYEVNVVEFDELENVYKLIQLESLLERNEFYFTIDNEAVVKFVTGVKDDQSSEDTGLVVRKKRKTEKVRPDDGTKKKRNKTVKKPAGTIVIDDDLYEGP